MGISKSALLALPIISPKRKVNRGGGGSQRWIKSHTHTQSHVHEHTHTYTHTHTHTHTTTTTTTTTSTQAQRAPKTCQQDKATRESVSRCFEPSHSQRITSGLSTNFTVFPSYSFHKSPYHKSCFLSLFISRGLSTRKSCIQQGDLFYSASLHRNRC